MKKREQSFLSFENVHKKILESIPDLVFVFDKEGRFLEFYNLDKSILYLNPDEFLGKPVKETSLPPVVRDTTDLLISQVLKSKQEKTFQYQLEFSGEIKYYESRMFYLDQNTVFALVRDISNIKNAQLVQKRLKEYYQKILNRVKQGIIECDYEGRIIYVNNSFAEIVGLQKSIIMGKNFYKEFGLIKLKNTINNFFSGETEKRKSLFSTTISHLGSIKNRKFKLSVIKQEEKSGKKEELYNISFDDITSEEQQQETLKKNESTYRSLVEDSPNGILIRDLSRILYMNRVAMEMLGFKSQKEAKELLIEELYLPEYAPIVKKRLKDIDEGKKVSYIEIKIKRPVDGKIIEVETIASKIFYNGKEAYQISIKDISLEKKLTEEKLRADLAEESYSKLREEIVVRQQIEHELSTSLEEKNILLKEVHHRVKNNLQIISSILNLEIRTENNQDVTQAFKRIQNRINSIYLIHEIVYQTNMFSRVDLGEYIKLISENFKRNADYEHLKIKFCMEKSYVSLDIGVPCGMIINELFYNYFENQKHFESGSELQVTMKQKNMHTELQIIYPKMKLFKTKISMVENSLSSQLIDALADQINGNYKIVTDNEKNTIFILQF